MYPDVVRRNCCSRFGVHEDNAKFIVLVVLLVLYMIAGAFLFRWTEYGYEVKANATYHKYHNEFMDKFHKNQTTVEDLLQFLHNFTAATSSGYNGSRSKWDFAGSIHFVATVVSTIGKLNYTYNFRFMFTLNTNALD